jgi:hypothetical protein
MKMRILLLMLAWIISPLHGFQKVIIWGHKLHSHTHSYIHNGFYNAFTYLGYPTFWFDDRDELKDFDFRDCLFLTEGQVDKKIPLRPDCEYMLHNCTDPKYRTLPKKNFIAFQVFTESIFSVPSLVKLDTCIYYDLPGRCIYMPWATDLLPDDIDAVKASLSSLPILSQVYWVGTVGDGTFGNIHQLKPFMKACEENGLSFIVKHHLSREDHMAAIGSSFIAPAIVGKWQAEQGYIPCRIFKNISYGKMGVTNSRHAYELFDKKIVYNPDTYQLFDDAKKKLESMDQDELFALMDLVKEKHTYLNRVALLLEFLQKVNTAFDNE